MDASGRSRTRCSRSRSTRSAPEGARSRGLAAAFFAAELGMRRVVVPPLPGSFSAFGLLTADVRHDYVRTRLTGTREAELGDVRAIVEGLLDEARRRLADDGFADTAMRFDARLEMRYVGQAFELSVPFDRNLASMDDLEHAFYAAHERRYAHAVPDPVEIVSFRVSGYGLVQKPALPRPLEGSVEAARTGERPVAFDGMFHTTL